MSRIGNIVGTLLPAGETGDPPFLTQSIEFTPPSREYFMGIGLMAHVPYDFYPGDSEKPGEGPGVSSTTPRLDAR